MTFFPLYINRKYGPEPYFHCVILLFLPLGPIIQLIYGDRTFLNSTSIYGDTEENS